MLSSFVQADSRPQQGQSLTHAQPPWKRLSHSYWKPDFLIAPLPNTSSSINYVSEGDMCCKTQHFTFACWSVADIFKCDKQLTLHNNNAYDDRTHSEVASWMLPTPDTEIFHNIIHWIKLSDSRNMLRLLHILSQTKSFISSITLEKFGKSYFKFCRMWQLCCPSMNNPHNITSRVLLPNFLNISWVIPDIMNNYLHIRNVSYVS
jgi:hypothetical protein